ncbi:DUF2207 domain-containing protein [Clostridium polynesiense]|uniref:DUF2207 domain-containing protein n=1 Tax=Clostridium polynesiense TaxID=1325933 RepID=UPI00058C20DB|nr:DUF2207 domain-containing protein [Clostridium polynesiense]
MKFKLYLMSLLCAVSLFFLGHTAYAEELVVNEQRIYAEIMNDGSLRVNDDTVFDISGYYNGMFRDISYDKAKSIKILRVQEAVDPQKPGSEMLNYSKVGKAKEGDSEVYTLEDDKKNNIRVKIFSPSKNTVKGFRVSYELKGAVNKYKDTSEFYWKFIGKNNETPIRRLEIYLRFPNGALKENIKVFGHGPLNGNVKILDDRTALFTVDNLKSNTFVEVRALFPPELLSGVPASNEEKLSSILQEEQGYTEKANKKIKVNNTFINLSKIAPIAVIIINAFILAFIIYQIRKGKYNEYAKEVINIERYNPVLLSFYSESYAGKISNVLLAQLLDFVRRGHLTIEELKDANDSRFLKTHKEEQLLPHEEYIMKWFIEDIGDGNGVTLTEIENYSKDNKEENSKKAYEWINLIRKEVANLDYRDKGKFKIKATVLVVEILFYIISILSLVLGNVLYGILSLVISIITSISAALMKTRNEEGQIAYENYKFIKDKLKGFDEKEAKELMDNMELGEIYLVYSALFNLKDNFMSKMKLNIGDNYNPANYQSYYLWSSYHLYDGNFDLNSTLDNSFSSYDTNLGSGGSFSGGSSGVSSGGGGGSGGF